MVTLLLSLQQMDARLNLLGFKGLIPCRVRISPCKNQAFECLIFILYLYQNEKLHFGRAFRD